MQTGVTGAVWQTRAWDSETHYVGIVPGNDHDNRARGVHLVLNLGNAPNDSQFTTSPTMTVFSGCTPHDRQNRSELRL